MFDTLIAPSQLAAHLGEPDWVVIDCRFELERPRWGEEEYSRARIPRARYAHLDRNLSGAVSAATGRHPLPPPERLAEQFGRWGIGAHSQVVAYDQGPGAYASRLWWLLRWLNHRQVAVLDGGLAAWRAERLPMEQGPASAAGDPPTRFEGRPNEGMTAGTAEIEHAIDSGELSRGRCVLVDARAADRFAGRNETLDPVAGHVPGACNLPFADNLTEGRFLPAERLRERFARVLAGQPAEALVCMCGSGVTACHNLLALEAAGLRGARLYAGSWSEWIRDPRRPVARDS